jgi:hypothetical protein
VVAALARRLEEIMGDPEIPEALRQVIQHRRDTTKFLPPDLQAQLIEDEIGHTYFSALTAADSTEINRTHATLAQLAKQERVEAIITTNFDTLLEQALELAGVRFRCFSSPKDFEELAHESAELKLVKVHGTAKSPHTMVDTLRQRLQGRPEPLVAWLGDRFIATPTLSLGLSGEDLAYRKDYLAIRPSIEAGAVFGILIRAGEEPSGPIRELKKLAPARVTCFSGELPGWLTEFASVKVG